MKRNLRSLLIGGAFIASLVCLLAVWLSGCEEPGPLVSNPPCAVCFRTVDHLDFGQVLVGTTREMSFEIINAGKSQLDIESISPTNQSPAPPPNVFQVTYPPGPVTLQPGQSTTVRVTFQPSGTVTYTAQLQINTRATCQTPCDAVLLVGVGTNISPPQSASVMRWGQIGYFGWQFKDSPLRGSVVADSVTGRVNPAHDAETLSRAGTSLADFVYLGLANATATNLGGYILAANGAQVLTGAYQTFDETHTHVPDTGYLSEKAILVKAGDVIAIKTRDGRYAKIQVDMLFPNGGSVTEEMQFHQIFPAVAP